MIILIVYCVIVVTVNITMVVISIVHMNFLRMVCREDERACGTLQNLPAVLVVPRTGVFSSLRRQNGS